MKTKKIITLTIFIFIAINILNPVTPGLNIVKNKTIAKEKQISSTNGNILYVGGDGANNYTFINDAIKAASDNDTIFVYNGTYYEYIRLYKSLKIIGENKNSTIIDCLDKTDVIRIIADNVSIKNFTINDAGQNFWYKTDAGVEITKNHNNINIENNIITNGYCGVLLQDSDNVTIKNNIFQKNNGPSIWLFGESKNNKIIENKIHRNKNDNGGGIWLQNLSANNTIKNNNFTNCGVFFFGNTIDHFTQNIEGNTINDKPLFYSINQNKVKIPDDAVNIILVNCSNTRLNNKNIGYTEVGVLLAFCRNITINNSFFSNCNAGVGLVNVDNCTITNNNITNIGDAIIIRYSNDNIIKNNIIFKANRLGIEAIQSNNNLIVENIVSTNYSTRNIELLSSYNNQVYHNNFLVYKKNINHPYYIAVDTGLNQWDDGQLGNYWWDYEEKNLDAENNGLTYEEPYEIAPYNTIDRHPLVKPIGMCSNPPGKPADIYGSRFGGKNKIHIYNTTSTDPDGDEIYYMFDWGDGTNSGWLGPYSSGSTMIVNKTWEKIGIYKIRVKARDIYGFDSEWSEPIKVIISREKKTIKNITIELLQKLYRLFTG